MQGPEEAEAAAAAAGADDVGVDVIDAAAWSFVVPTACMNEPQQVAQFTRGTTCSRFVAFITRCNDAIKGMKRSDVGPPSANVTAVTHMLDQMESWADDIQPLDQPMRYGNKAFQTWFDRVAESANALVQTLLPAHQQGATVELGPYLRESVGNRVRIDYGTGHETSFIALLYCLDRLGFWSASAGDYAAVPLIVFHRYVSLMRKIQMRYGLEPAGSHGVWSLDDYHFIPFLWGSAQLIGHDHIVPRNAVTPDVVTKWASEYLYLDALRYIAAVKTGPFAEHSPVLYSLTQCPHWPKINGGMFKMYEGEVLCKFPVMQHFLLGSLLPPPS